MKTLISVAICVAAASAHADTVLLKNARIYTVVSGVIERGDILIKDGKIVSVGAAAHVPHGAKVIDAAGKCIMPGIVDANSRAGMRIENEESREVTTRVKSIHLVDPESPQLMRALQSGVTAACVTPGSANVVGGVCSVIRPIRGANRIIRETYAVRAALGQDVYGSNSSFRGAGGGLANIFSRRPNSRMGTVWELRQALFQADRDPVIAEAVAGRAPLRFHARTENDIRVVFTLMDEFKLKRVILDDAVEAYKVAEQIAARRIPVVLGPFADPQYAYVEATEAMLNSAGLLAAKGVHVAFGSNGGNPSELRAWASLASRNGLPPEVALRAITLNAAAVAGVSSRIGSIEPGKDADLLILSGDPLQITSRVERVLIRGQVVYHAD